LNTQHNPNSTDDFDMSSTVGQKPTIDSVIELLRGLQGEVLPAALYYGLSDLSDEHIHVLAPVWADLDADLRRRIISELTEASENDFTLAYSKLGYIGLDDPVDEVRASAIEMLWVDESEVFLLWLLNAAQMDDSALVRSAACSALGHFVLRGEFEEHPPQQIAQALDVAINIWMDETEDVQVRRRALEALSNSSHEMVPDAIQTAYESDDYWFRVSAVFAMGRSADRYWRKIVLAEMSSGDVEIRYEATRAAGELGLFEAVKSLGYLALDSDREVSLAAIWSLGEIGGSETLRILGALADDFEHSRDKDMLEAVEDAMGSATLVGDLLVDDEESDDL